MKYLLTGVISGLCLAGGLVAPSHAVADPEPSDCPQSAQNSVQLGQETQPLSGSNPRVAAKLAKVAFTPDTDNSDDSDGAPAQGLNVKLQSEGCWGQPQAAQGPDGSQILQFQRGGSGTVAVTAEMSAGPRDLSDVLGYDRQQILSAAKADRGSASQIEVLENEASDYQGNPSWLVRARTSVRGRDGGIGFFETTTREIVLAGRDNTYLVTIVGTASLTAEPGGPAASPDTDSANAVYEQVKSGLTATASR